MPDYRYKCTFGHEMLSPKPMTICPAWVLGDPCEGTLKQTAGPRDKQQQEGEPDDDEQ